MTVSDQLVKMEGPVWMTGAHTHTSARTDTMAHSVRMVSGC